jgi:hypothetical protein
MDPVKLIEDSLLKVESGLRNLPTIIHSYEGYSGSYTREFYNRICSIPNCSYLEIGTWYGSSSISALYGNSVTATFIDNWSEFNGNKNILINALEKYKGNSKYTLIENDCWKVDTTQLSQYDVYLYDGPHTYSDQYNAIVKYYDCLKNNCIIMIDDWNWPDVQNGTRDGFKKVGANIIYSKEIVLPISDTINMPKHKGANTWWNGIGIFVISK